MKDIKKSNHFLQEYELSKNKFKYKIVIEKNNKGIEIKYKNDYKIHLDSNNIKLYTKNLFNNIEEFFKSINNSFKNNKVILKEIITNLKIKLEVNLNINNKNKNLEIILFYNKNSENKNNYEKIGNTTLNPKDLKFNNIISDHSLISTLGITPNNNNSMVIFNSIDDILYIIYSRNISVILFNINDNKISLEIKEYDRTILFNYYFDNINKRDLLATSSNLDIKIWNINNLECLYNIIIPADLFVHPHKWPKSIQTLFFINNKNHIYINVVFPHYDLPMQVYDLNGEKIKNVKINLKEINYMGSFSDKNKSYFFACGNKFVKSFDFEKNDIYKNYINNSDKNNYTHAVINNSDIIKKIISCNCIGGIKIWNFHSGQLLNDIEVLKSKITSICLWNNDYLFAACENNPFVLINLSNKEIIKYFGEKEECTLAIKKGIQDKYGECLITQHSKYGKIKLWKINN